MCAYEGGEMRTDGKPVNVDNWAELVPGDAIDDVTVKRQVEDGLGVHHAWILWHAREVVVLDGEIPDNAVHGEVVLWWVAPGERLSWNIDLAATLYWLKLGESPREVFIRKLPANCPCELEVQLSNKLRVSLALKEALWAPTRFVVVA